MILNKIQGGCEKKVKLNSKNKKNGKAEKAGGKKFKKND